MGATDADKVSALAVLHNMNEHFGSPAQKVAVKQSNERVLVIASAVIPAQSIV